MNSSSFESGSITKAIAQLGDMDEAAAELIWSRYFQRLTAFAESKIFGRHRRYFDGEDIAAAGLFALFDGIRNNRFERPGNRDAFWQLLVAITANKAANNRKFYDRKKRGGGKVLGGAAFESSEVSQFANWIQRESDPAEFVELEATCQELLRRLPDDSYRKIALMRMAGHSNLEMAEEMQCTQRTVERKLAAIRKVWIQLNED